MLEYIALVSKVKENFFFLLIYHCIKKKKTPSRSFVIPCVTLTRAFNKLYVANFLI